MDPPDHLRKSAVRLAETAVEEDQSARLEKMITRVAQRLKRLSEMDRFEVAHGFIERVIVGADQGLEIQAYVQAPEKQSSQFIGTAWEDFSIASMTS